MRILAADTATSIIAVAVCEGTRVLAETLVDCGRGHCEHIVDTADWVLTQAATPLETIDMLAISNGPGSFTGLRVGVAAWKGLALGARLPLVTVPTLDAMTHCASMRDGTLCVLLDAKMHEVFGAVYRFSGGRRETLVPAGVGPVERFIETIEGSALFLGDGADLYRAAIDKALPDASYAPRPHNVPRAAAIALEALARLDVGAETDPALAEPVYLRKSQAEEQREQAG